MELVIERRAIADNRILDARLHPVLQRAYAARGVRDSQDLSLTLDRLVPVSTLPLNGVSSSVLTTSSPSLNPSVTGLRPAAGSHSAALPGLGRHRHHRIRGGFLGKPDLCG